MNHAKCTEKRGKDYHFVTWLRVAAVLFILITHFAQQSENSYIVLSSQFFNVGVYFFLIISGFVFGIRGKIDSVFLWYKKRIKRIYFPYELMVVTLFLIYLVQGRNIDIVKWLFQITGLQGWNGVYGAIHTWFITTILVCYSITPALSRIIHNKKHAAIIVCLISVIPVAFSYAPIDLSLLIPVNAYISAYTVGYWFDELNCYRPRLIIAISVSIVSLSARFGLRFFFDDTVFYNKVVTYYTQLFFSFSIFYLFYYLLNSRRIPKGIQFINDISFEVYLWHYMFTDGPLRLFGLTGIWIIDCLIVLLVTILVAALTHYFLSYAMLIINNNHNRRDTA